MKSILIPTIVGPRPVPMTEAVYNRIAGNDNATILAGARIFNRLLDAKRAYQKQKTAKAHEAIRQSGMVYAYCHVLADMFGMAPTFWEMGAIQTLKEARQ